MMPKVSVTRPREHSQGMKLLNTSESASRLQALRVKSWSAHVRGVAVLSSCSARQSLAPAAASVVVTFESIDQIEGSPGGASHLV